MQNTYPTRPSPRRPVRRHGCGWQLAIAALTFFAFVLGSCAFVTMVLIVAPPKPVTILVMGLDSRGQEGFVARTDSIMLAGFRPRNWSASLLSIPRDLTINAPGYGAQRINTINFLGEAERSGYGPDLLKQSIALSFGIEPTHYVRLDFAAFEELIDAVGGVTIDVPRLIVDSNYPTADYGVQTVRFEPGRQRMNGERALIYARTRYADDDYQRAGRQQQVVNAFVRRLLNPIYWPAVTSVLIRSIDTDLGPADILIMAPIILVNAGQFDSLVIDRDYVSPGAQGPVPNYDLILPWMQTRFE
jgi:LCP family protein required for cell wall assembly